MELLRIKITDVIVKNRYRKVMGDIPGLAENMQSEGLWEPIGLNTANVLVYGGRRLAAAKLLGWSHIDAVVLKSLDDHLSALRAEMGENTFRESLLPTEAYNLSLTIEEAEKDAASQRRKMGNSKKKVVNNPTPCGKFPPDRKGKVQDIIAEVTGYSPKTMKKIKAVVKAAEDDPVTNGPIRDEMDRTGKVDPAFRKVNGQIPTREKVLPTYDQIVDTLQSGILTGDELVNLGVFLYQAIDKTPDSDHHYNDLINSLKRHHP